MTRGSTHAPMDVESSSFPILTTEEEIDDQEAEKSFKELQDWIRYIAQHKGQHQ